jgi:argininosuccinate lyase
MESAKKHQNVLPGYTIYKLQCHRLWDVVSAYAETLIDDITMLNAALKL